MDAIGRVKTQITTAIYYRKLLYDYIELHNEYHFAECALDAWVFQRKLTLPYANTSPAEVRIIRSKSTACIPC